MIITKVILNDCDRKLLIKKFLTKDYIQRKILEHLRFANKKFICYQKKKLPLLFSRGNYDKMLICVAKRFALCDCRSKFERIQIKLQ